MDDADRLDAYHFYEREWDSYDDFQDEFEWDIPNEFNLASYIADRWAAAETEQTALYYRDLDGCTRSYTFTDIEEKASRLADFLYSRGIHRGDRIAIQGPQRPETLISHIAALKLGAVTIPLSILLGTEGLCYRLTHSDAKAIFVDSDVLGVLRSIRSNVESLKLSIVFDDVDTSDREVTFDGAMNSSTVSFPAVRTSPDDHACIVYTSGTTGKPKGVVHSHKYLLGILPPFVGSRGMAVTDDMVLRTIVEWSWVGSLNALIFPSWYYGLPVVGAKRREFDPVEEFDLIDTYGITSFSAPPSAMRMLMQVESPVERFDLGSVRQIRTGGEAVGQSIVNWANEVFPNADITEGYGQTEAPFLIGDLPAFDYGHKVGCMGVPTLGQKTVLLDPETRKVINEPGVVGEIAVDIEENPQIFEGYLNDEEATQKKFRGQWMLCEDLASIGPEGYYQFHSRKDEVILSSGYRIGPTEIEETIATHPAVEDVAVVGVDDSVRGQIPKAFILPVDEYAVNEALSNAFKEHVKDELAKYKYPREIEFVDSLPRTSTGKVKRTALEGDFG